METWAILTAVWLLSYAFNLIYMMIIINRDFPGDELAVPAYIILLILAPLAAALFALEAIVHKTSR